MTRDKAHPNQTNGCKHNIFQGDVKVGRLIDTDNGPVNGFVAEVRVNCVDCGMPFQWIGLERGLHYGKPTVSADGFELRAPITPLEEL